MRLHRRLTENQLAGDLAVGQAAGDQSENLELALGEILGQRGRLWRGLAGERLDQRSCHRRGQQRFTAGHHAHRGDELLGWRVLQEESAGTGAHRLEHVLVEVERGQDQDARADRRGRPGVAGWLRCRPSRACGRPSAPRPGFSRLQCSSASRPLAAVQHTLRSGSASRIIWKPVRISAWSSTMATDRVTRGPRCARPAGWSAGSPPPDSRRRGRGPVTSEPSKSSTRSRMPTRPLPVPGAAGVAAGASSRVDDHDSQRVALIGKAEPGRGPPRCA